MFQTSSKRGELEKGLKMDTSKVKMVLVTWYHPREGKWE